ncbi:hypothetical protein T8A63_15355 [Sulfitobacter sp. OXR-159]|uniref:hypothetical protein n=1 Tax=Sulfitobacter sp. OXR-159 TaxID=3100174 RepID=UPI002AC91203|nr:hypothetical protein [Sulfitobacter sp. OXR-159]WPZ28990.1 hypothetical protein T8A63_15355 [Sulfitobacter sp. OXR-159]
MRLTIICPEAHREDANQLAMVLGYGPADAATYGEASWQDTEGNRYAAASLDVAPVLVSDATSTLERPVWDTENSDEDGVGYQINMAGAERAQALVSIWGLGEDEPDPVADPNTILAMFHDEPLAILARAGVARVAEERAMT